MKIFHSKSAKETQAFGAELATQMPSRILALTGNLGAGKTTFSQGFIKALGIKKRVLSPTFIIFRAYPLKDGRKLYHMDLYRLESLEELEPIGFKEIVSDVNNIVLIEWPEKAKELIPKDATWLTFETEPVHGQVSISMDSVV